MSRICWISALILAGAAQAAEPAHVTLDVPGMNCSLCPLAVVRVLRRQPGVRDASASLDTKSAAVDFDPALTSPARLARAVSNTGYPATPREP
ncbi:MAG TPA: heavy metal-associated domain-containing protein [Burkholderiales bacterium]|nr:heavy metal-associated domain-containing protein [Burkholderiales bacterium]